MASTTGEAAGAEGVDAKRLAKGLGWFSNALAVAQLAAPGRFARAIGARDGSRARLLVRAVGAREAAVGIGILARRRRGGWLWARAAGDLADLALLGVAMRAKHARRNRLGAAAAAVAGVTVVDAIAARRLRNGERGGGASVTKVLTVNHPPEEVYRFWHDFANFPRFMAHLESVRVESGGRSHWKAKGPAGKTVEWDAEVVEDVPNRRIAWRSLPGAGVENSGSVEFTAAPRGRGTEVRVELRYDPPAGAFGSAVAKLFGEEPRPQLDDDLRRFKQVIETGEVARSEATPDGPSLAQHLRQRAAQPLARERGGSRR
jgi:uncharacterized membrane protein